MRISTWVWLAWQRARSPLRLLLGPGFLAIVTALQLLKGHGALPLPGLAFVVAYMLGAGLIGLDRQRGLLAVIASRPITRSAYVLNRWAALCVLVIATFAAVLAASVATAALVARGELPLGGELVEWTWQLAICTGSGAAMLALASSITRGTADVALLVAGAVSCALMNEAADALGIGPLVRPVLNAAIIVLLPQVEMGSEPKELLALACNGALCLLLAVVITNRREIHSRGEA